jgi:hypothetical protein
MSYYGFKSEVLARLDKIIANQDVNVKQGMTIMATLDEVVAKVTQETTDIGSLKVFVQGLQDQIKVVPGMTPAMQAQIDTIFTTVASNDQAIVTAMKANVPVTTPVPSVVPPVVVGA